MGYPRQAHPQAWLPCPLHGAIGSCQRLAQPLVLIRKIASVRTSLPALLSWMRLMRFSRSMSVIGFLLQRRSGEKRGLLMPVPAIGDLVVVAADAAQGGAETFVLGP